MIHETEIRGNIVVIYSWKGSLLHAYKECNNYKSKNGYGNRHILDYNLFYKYWGIYCERPVEERYEFMKKINLLSKFDLCAICGNPIRSGLIKC